MKERMKVRGEEKEGKGEREERRGEERRTNVTLSANLSGRLAELVAKG